MKLSCIIPVGPNIAQWLPAAYESAIHCNVDEVIMVLHRDSLFAEEYLSESKGLRVIRDWSSGSRIGHAKNLGISIASGDWICILDSDDLMIQAGVVSVREEIATNRWDVVYGRVREFGDGIEPHEWPFNSIPSLLPEQNQVPVSAWFRRDMWWRIHGFRNVRYEDWDFWLRAWQSGCRFCMIPQVFYYHRRWPGSEGAKIGYRSDLGFQEL